MDILGILFLIRMVLCGALILYATHHQKRLLQLNDEDDFITNNVRVWLGPKTTKKEKYHFTRMLLGMGMSLFLIFMGIFIPWLEQIKVNEIIFCTIPAQQEKWKKTPQTKRLQGIVYSWGITNGLVKIIAALSDQKTCTSPGYECKMHHISLTVCDGYHRGL